jgi:hypothetical protein
VEKLEQRRSLGLRTFDRVDAYNIEQLAIETYERHGLNPATPASAFRIARAIGGPDAVTRPSQVIGRPAHAGWLGDRVRFGVRRTLSDEDANFFLAHEVAHVVRGIGHCSDPVIEQEIDALAAALMAPRPAMVALYRAFGWDVAALADEVIATQTWAALRLAEVYSVPVAAIGPESVRVRGSAWEWPHEAELRRVARRPGPGLTKVRITDRPRRIALRVAE